MTLQEATFTGIARFDSKVKVNEETGCWEWQAYRDRGYGQFQQGKLGKGLILAHRFAYQTIVGPIPEGLHLDHLCRNRCCVNPAHLEPVTQAENNRRSPIWTGNATHCPKGHEYTPENTYFHKHPSGRPRRFCRRCQLDRMRASYQKRKER